MASRLVSTCFRLASVNISNIAAPSASTLLNQNAHILATGTPPCRNASKKSGGVVRNRVGKANKKRKGVRQVDGNFVHKGDILVKRSGLLYYPGENVLQDQEGNLRAAYDGVVVVSTEQLEPYPDSPLHEYVQNGLTINKQFYNVIATPLHGKFQLVSQT